MRAVFGLAFQVLVLLAEVQVEVLQEFPSGAVSIPSSRRGSRVCPGLNEMQSKKEKDDISVDRPMSHLIDTYLLLIY